MPVSSSVHQNRCQKFLRCASSLLLFSVAAHGLRAQVPEANGPVCVPSSVSDCNFSGSGRSSGSSGVNYGPPIWDRIGTAIKNHRERTAPERARKAEEQRKKKQEEENRKAQAAQARYRAEQEARERVAAAERQRVLDEQARRLQAAFNQAKPGIVASLKGVDAAPAVTAPSASAPLAPQAAAPAVKVLGLKGVDSPSRGQTDTAWLKQITEPAVLPHARKLASVVPPLPISEKQVALDWKKIYLNENRLMDTADWVIGAWEMTGVLGEPIAMPCKVLMVAGKAFIAGEDAAWVYLTQKDQDYDAAAYYLKNPKTASEFAHLVQAMRDGRPVPNKADPAMIDAARVIVDPHLGKTGWMVWDAMTSREAMTAMLRKTAVEVGSELLAVESKGLVVDVAERKAVFDAVRQERTQLRKIVQSAAASDIERQQARIAMQEADKLSARIYRVNKVNDYIYSKYDDKFNEATSDLLEAVAEHYDGKELEGRVY